MCITLPGHFDSGSSASCVAPTLITSGELEGEYSQESLRKLPKMISQNY